jgi:hypothetical protein
VGCIQGTYKNKKQRPPTAAEAANAARAQTDRLALRISASRESQAAGGGAGV